MIYGSANGIMTHFFSGHNNNSEGIGILINPNFSYTIQNYSNIIDGRLQALDLIVNKKRIDNYKHIWTNNDNSAFYKQLEEYMQEKRRKHVHNRRRFQHCFE